MNHGGGVLGSWSTRKLDVPGRGHATEAGRDTLMQRRRAQPYGDRGEQHPLSKGGPGQVSVLCTGAKT